ncbi:lipoyl protein ligase domain-containing protein [Ideonella sp. A 288]|uniref:lipoyl protein ligase domain-containing protein n=1 Tax=Ideonella sp. A 288 TaxID=1962181 RepID=UPI000B4B71E4|nr:lipoate--protein ligase [Ideonella sp. A 288]
MGLPTFGFVAVHERPLADGIAAEADWMREVALHGRALAQLWQGAAGLVVPRSYERQPGWVAARERWAAAGRPVHVRASGGGLVPQGPGVLNLSLVWRGPVAPAAAPVDTDGVYRDLCDGLAAALSRLGIAASAQPVEGSFCDGRYNLAVDGRKLVGTAQSWRRIDGVPVALAHAVLLVDADPVQLTDEANAFEAALPSGRCYRADALTTVAQAWCSAHRQERAPADLGARCRHLLAEQFARVLPPLATCGSTEP